MINALHNKEFELIYVIINFGQGSKVLRYSKQNGILGGTIFLGIGTVNNKILKFLDMDDTRKEIVLMVAEKKVAYDALEALNAKFHLAKPNYGIAFSSSIANVFGTKAYNGIGRRENGGVENTMYNSIFVVVDKGKAEAVVDSAKKAGARGGTIINARGSGIHESTKLFLMDIEPEKELILILSENRLTDAIIASIRKDLKMDEPGNGIIFVQEVSKTYGLY